jgi:hypothetical protein
MWRSCELHAEEPNCRDQRIVANIIDANNKARRGLAIAAKASDQAGDKSS